MTENPGFFMMEITEDGLQRLTSNCQVVRKETRSTYTLRPRATTLLSCEYQSDALRGIIKEAERSSCNRNYDNLIMCSNMQESMYNLSAKRREEGEDRKTFRILIFNNIFVIVCVKDIIAELNYEVEKSKVFLHLRLLCTLALY